VKKPALIHTAASWPASELFISKVNVVEIDENFYWQQHLQRALKIFHYSVTYYMLSSYFIQYTFIPLKFWIKCSSQPSTRSQSLYIPSWMYPLFHVYFIPALRLVKLQYYDKRGTF
jgi:hypothetical protein